MTIKVIYTDLDIKFKDTLLNYIKTKFPELKVEMYNESYYKDKKKAITTKASCGAKLSPFTAVYENGNIIKAFYSETKDCTFDNIKNYLNDI